MHHQANTQQPIQHRILASAGDECGGCERYETCGKKTFECPVVGAVRFGRGREVCWIVYCAFVNRYITTGEIGLSVKRPRKVESGTHDHRVCRLLWRLKRVWLFIRRWQYQKQLDSLSFRHKPWTAVRRMERPEATRKGLRNTGRRKRDVDMFVFVVVQELRP